MHPSTKLLIVGSLVFGCTVFCNQGEAFEVRDHPEFFIDFEVKYGTMQFYFGF